MNQDTAHRFGEYIKRLRKEQKCSVRSLASKAGLNSGELSRLENGKRNPQPGTLKALATALGVPLADMFAMADYIVPYDLPSMAPYLRARYGHLPEETRDAVNNYLERLIDEHDLDPGGPLDFEDEPSESPQH